MNGRPWVDGEVAALRDAAARGLTMAQAAEELGRSRSAVTNKAQSLGVSFKGRRSCRRPWGDADDARLVGLVGSGARCADVAEALGRSEASVYKRAHTLGLRFSADVDWHAVERACADGLTLAQAAGQVGLQERALWSRFYRRYGMSYAAWAASLRNSKATNACKA